MTDPQRPDAMTGRRHNDPEMSSLLQDSGDFCNSDERPDERVSMAEQQIRNALGISPEREHTGGKWRMKCHWCGNWYPDDEGDWLWKAGLWICDPCIVVKSGPPKEPNHD